MRRKISNRTRRDAIKICSIVACTPSVYMSSSAARELGLPMYGFAESLAYAAAEFVRGSFWRATSYRLENAECYQEAEALLRCGWVPRFDRSGDLLWDGEVRW